MRVFYTDEMVVNIEDDCQTLDRFISQGAEEIPIGIFGDYPHFADRVNTTKVNGQWVFDFDPSPVIERETAIAAANQRKAAIEAVKESEGGSKYTIEQLDSWLDGLFDPTAFNATGAAINNLSDEDMSPEARAAIVALAMEIRNVFSNTKDALRKVGVEILK